MVILHGLKLRYFQVTLKYENHKNLKILSIFYGFSNYAKPTGAGKVRFLRFH